MRDNEEKIDNSEKYGQWEHCWKVRGGWGEGELGAGWQLLGVSEGEQAGEQTGAVEGTAQPQTKGNVGGCSPGSSSLCRLPGNSQGMELTPRTSIFLLGSHGLAWRDPVLQAFL